MRAYTIFAKYGAFHSYSTRQVFSFKARGFTPDEAVDTFARGRPDLIPVAWTEPSGAGRGESNALHPVYPADRPVYRADAGLLCGEGLL